MNQLSTEKPLDWNVENEAAIAIINVCRRADRGFAGRATFVRAVPAARLKVGSLFRELCKLFGFSSAASLNGRTPS
jgi:hypothetical protein